MATVSAFLRDHFYVAVFKAIFFNVLILLFVNLR